VCIWPFDVFGLSGLFGLSGPGWTPEGFPVQRGKSVENDKLAIKLLS